MKKEKLIQFRKARNISILQMSSLLKVNYELLSNIENGKTEISADFENRFFDVFITSFTRTEREMFKEKFMYENIKLLEKDKIDDSNYNEKLSIGDVIARFRNRYRFTQDYMGKQLGVSRSTLSLVETNRCTLSNDVVNRFFSLYGNQLLNDEKLPFMQVLDSKTIISNLIMNNDLVDVLCNIEKLKLSKDDITVLFNSTLEQAKQLKKQRKRM